MTEEGGGLTAGSAASGRPGRRPRLRAPPRTPRAARLARALSSRSAAVHAFARVQYRIIVFDLTRVHRCF